MGDTSERPTAFWRGAWEPSADRKALRPPEAATAGRLLLAVEVAGNLNRLASHLGQYYEILSPDGNLLEQEFDLAILDVGGFLRWRDMLTAVKNRAQPVFLPIMLILPRVELNRDLRSYWGLVDELLAAPIDRSELTQRVLMLLRARRLALAQRSHLAYLVHHDRVTGLPNKTLFLDRLDQAVHDATVLGQKVHACIIDIPLLPVLKSLGTRGLERAAVECSERLQNLLDGDFSLARLTTEQWGLLVRAGASIEDVLDVCRKVQRLESAPLEVDGERVHVSPRVGVAQYPDDAPDASALLDRAVAALSQSKKSSAPAFYSGQVQRQALRFIRTEARLHEALERDQFELWLQPKVTLAERKIAGAEALVRWRLPSGELVAPDNFIPIAESSGLIMQIDRWILEQACATMRQWNAAGHPLPRIAVNVSVEHLGEAEFVSTIMDTLSRYALPPSALEIELTETALADLNAENLARLTALRDRGISIALDDFGTGYCSLSYLHKLPITTLKIDKSFVSDLPHKQSSVAITQTVVALANNFDLEVVAEGIETEEQAAFLQSLNVQVGQGFLFGRPIPAAEFQQYLATPCGGVRKAKAVVMEQ